MMDCYDFRQLIYNYPEQLFADANVMAIEHADFEGVERLALVTGILTLTLIMLDIFVYYTRPQFLPKQHIGFLLVESIYKKSRNLFIKIQSTSELRVRLEP